MAEPFDVRIAPLPRYRFCDTAEISRTKSGCRPRRKRHDLAKPHGLPARHETDIRDFPHGEIADGT